MEREEEKIELRSEEFQEVLGWVPPWILRWGITTLAIIICILLIGSAIFKYPDAITSTIVLTGSTPPATVVAKASGKLTELAVKDNQKVTAGTYLAVIENAAHTKDILTLKAYMKTLRLDRDTLLFLPPKELQLGSLQSLYSTFYITLFEYAEYKRLKYYPQKIEFLKERMVRYKMQYRNTLRQKKIVEGQLAITRKQFQRDSALNVKGIISSEDLENTQGQYLQSMLSYENSCSSLENMQMQITQLKESLLDTRYQDIDKGNTLESELKTLSTQLQTELQSWELTYALMAPIEGKITFTNYWVENQNITNGEEVFSIIPTENVQLIGKALLPIARSGKVETGQKVNIRFDNFPDNEYGIVRGVVKNISLVPSKEKETDYYTVEIELPDKLRTTYNKTLPYLPRMQGAADIITKDISVLERFFMPIKKVITESL